LDPDLMARLLSNLFDLKIPEYDHARPHATDVRVMVPRTYHADSMVVFSDAADRPVLAAVLEVQRGWDLTKRRTWKLYVSQLEAELGVDTALIVYCPDPTIARRYSALFITDGLCLFLRPLIFTPEDVPLVVDIDVARANPSFAVLSALCHSGDAEVEDAFPALVEALRSAGPAQALLYHDIVLAGLPGATRIHWEAFMTTAADYEFQSELLRNLAAKYQAEHQAIGEARGEARAVLAVLEGRGVTVPDHVRDQVLECTDTSRLDLWLRRAITAVTAEDVIRESAP
jgi:hypothetical protein